MKRELRCCSVQARLQASYNVTLCRLSHIFSIPPPYIEFETNWYHVSLHTRDLLHTPFK
jgi:hypothetical protein